MSDIFILSLRQLAGRWRLLLILSLAALPILNAAVAAAVSDSVTAAQVDSFLINGMLAGAILPLIVLGVATAAFANEVEDRTLSNLTLTPAPRWQIVMSKLTAAFAISAPAPAISGAIALTLLMGAAGLDGAGTSAAALVAGLLVGAAVYSSVFLWMGLLGTRALGFGLLYVFLWEGLFSSFVSGIRYLSIRQYIIGIVHGLDDRRFPDAQDLLSFPVALGMAAVVFAAFTALSVRRLRQMDVP